MADLPLTQTQVGTIEQSTATDTTNANSRLPRTMVVGSDGSALNKYTYSSNPYAGASVALSSPPATLTAGADTALSFAGTVNHVYLENNTASVVNYDYDTAATAGSPVLNPGDWRLIDWPLTTLHLLCSVAVALNGGAAGNLIVRARG